MDVRGLASIRNAPRRTRPRTLPVGTQATAAWATLPGAPAVRLGRSRLCQRCQPHTPLTRRTSSRAALDLEPALLEGLAPASVPRRLADLLDLATGDSPSRLVVGFRDEQPASLVEDQRACRRRDPRDLPGRLGTDAVDHDVIIVVGEAHDGGSGLCAAPLTGPRVGRVLKETRADAGTRTPDPFITSMAWDLRSLALGREKSGIASSDELSRGNHL
jgi:hypothetical protein